LRAALPPLKNHAAAHGPVVVALVALLAGAGPGEAAPYREYEVRLHEGAAPPAGDLRSDADIINAVARLMRDKLGLPFPAVTKAYVYVNQASLVDGLLRIAGETSEEAWDKGRVAAGVATRVGIFLRGDRLAHMHLLARAGLFAHELAHVSQLKMREGGRGRAAQWILEGHADWVKFRLLDLLGMQAYATSREEVVRSIVRSATRPKFFPGLEALTGNARWTSTTKQLGPAATYGQAFLAVDWLIERYGSAKLLEFFERFALDANPQEHWRAVFPIPYRQFVDECRARLEGPTLAPAEVSPAPAPPSFPRRP